jgi:hypothetical protein
MTGGSAIKACNFLGEVFFHKIMKQARVSKNDAGYALSDKPLNHIVYLPVVLF